MNKNTDAVRHVPDNARAVVWSWKQIFSAARLGLVGVEFDAACETKAYFTFAP